MLRPRGLSQHLRRAQRARFLQSALSDQALHRQGHLRRSSQRQRPLLSRCRSRRANRRGRSAAHPGVFPGHSRRRLMRSTLHLPVHRTWWKGPLPVLSGGRESVCVRVCAWERAYVLLWPGVAFYEQTRSRRRLESRPETTIRDTLGRIYLTSSTRILDHLSISIYQGYILLYSHL